jgi:hypothetical protein
MAPEFEQAAQELAGKSSQLLLSIDDVHRFANLTIN